MILDAHCHLGTDCVYDFSVTEELLQNTHSTNGIDGGIVQPCITRPYLEDARNIHDRIYQFTQNSSGYYWGMISLSPHFYETDFKEEVRRCVKELNFVGIKLTPNGHAVDILSQDARMLLKTAHDFQIPVMVHTGMGLPFADPVRLRRIASEFSDLKIVIAHAGSDFFMTQAMYLAQDFDNVYLEPSGIGIEGIETLIHNLAPHKIMFSTDVPVQTPTELLKYRTIVHDPAVLEQIFSKTAIDVFNLKF